MNEELKNDQDLLKRYAELKEIIKLAETELKSINEDVKKTVQSASGKLSFDFGKFIIRQRKSITYQYSPAVEAIEQEIETLIKPYNAKLEGLKKEEEISGTALKKEQVSESLVFTPSK